MKRIFVMMMVVGGVLLTGCTRIETGEVGLRVNMSKQVSNDELPEGSWNQTLIGDVLTFPVKEVAVKVDDLNPQAADNSTMKDFDVTVIYNINRSQVAEIYNTKNKSFHARHDGDTYLMYNYIFNATRNAVYKSARKYEALNMGDNRSPMESEIVPADTVVESANALVRAKNETKQKEAEVRTAQLEAQRIQALAQNQGAIAYMDAQTRMKQAEAALVTAQSIAHFKGGTLVLGGPSPVLNVAK